MQERAEHRQAVRRHKRMTERERKNAGRPLSPLSAARPVVSAYQPWFLRVWSFDLNKTQDSGLLFDFLYAVFIRLNNLVLPPSVV